MGKWADNPVRQKTYIVTTGLKILYFLFVTASLLLGLFTIWFNLQEIIDRSLGHDTFFSQMYHLTDKESIWYSTAYLIPYLTATTLGSLFVYKKKKTKAIICFIIIFSIFGIELYTDSLFLDRV